MRILGFVKGDASVASSRHRYWQIAEAMTRDLDVSFTTLLPQDVDKRSIRELRALVKTHDAIWLQRPLYKKESFFKLLLVLITTRKPKLFDYDDAIYRHSKIKFALLALCASVIVAGNKTLAKALFGLRHAHIIPTTIPASILKQTPAETHDELRIGWAGDAIAHKDNLRLLIEPLKKLKKNGVKFSFLLIGAKHDQGVYQMFSFLEKQVTIIDQIPWVDVLAHLEKLDVGVMPLVDNEWNRGKCALKAIEYMALGKPAIVSPVGMNEELMQDGLESLLARQTDDWVSILSRLAADKNELDDYSTRCYARVKSTYTNEAVSIRYLSLLRSFL